MYIRGVCARVLKIVDSNYLLITAVCWNTTMDFGLETIQSAYGMSVVLLGCALVMIKMIKSGTCIGLIKLIGSKTLVNVS